MFTLIALGVGAAYVYSLAALLVPVIALVLAYLALQEIERNPRVGGRGLAITGAATAVVGVVWSVTMFFVLAGKPFVD